MKFNVILLTFLGPLLVVFGVAHMLVHSVLLLVIRDINVLPSGAVCTVVGALLMMFADRLRRNNPLL